MAFDISAKTAIQHSANDFLLANQPTEPDQPIDPAAEEAFDAAATQQQNFKKPSEALLETLRIRLQTPNYPINEIIRAIIEYDPGYFRGRDMSLKNLFDLDLSGIDFSFADLSFTRLTGSNLKGANFTGAKLTRAKLKQADLSGATLIDANIEYADFSNANLAAANLAGANLDHANFSNANLTNTNLKGANLSYLDFHGANLTSANLAEANLTFTDFYATNLSRANLKDIKHDHIQAVLADDTIAWNQKAKRLFQDRVNLLVIKIIAPEIFQNADLAGLNLEWLDFSGINFSGANLTDTAFLGANLTGTNLENIKHDKVSAILADNNIAWNQKAKVMLQSGIDPRIINVIAPEVLQQADLSDLHLIRFNFNGINLAGANFSNSNLTNATFISANLAGVNFTGTNFYGTNITNANIENSIADQPLEPDAEGLVSFGQGIFVPPKDPPPIATPDVDLLIKQREQVTAVLQDDSIPNNQKARTLLLNEIKPEVIKDMSINLRIENVFRNADLRNLELKQMRFNGIDLTGANFTGTNFDDVDFSGTKLTDADFTETNLQKVKFNSSTNFKGANFTRANFTNNSEAFYGLDLSAATFTDIRHDDITAIMQDDSIPRNKKALQLLLKVTSAHIIDAVAPGIFQNADLNDLKFHWSDFSGIDLSGVNFSGTSFYHTRFSNSNLMDANFTDAYLNSVFFIKTNLTGANFTAATIYSIYDSDSNFSRANFTAACMSTRFLNANFADANFTDVYIPGIFNILQDGTLSTSKKIEKLLKNKIDPRLINAILPDLFRNADLSGLKLQELDFSGLDLEGTDFTDTFLFHTKFIGTNLRGVNFTSADLRYANLEQANLQNANLEYAILTNVNLQGAILADDSKPATDDNTTQQLWAEPPANEITAENLLPPGWEDYQHAGDRLINQAGITYAPELPGYGETERLLGKDLAQGLHPGPIDQPIPGFDDLTSSFPNGSTLDFNPNDINIPSNAELAASIQHTGHTDSNKIERKLFDPNPPEFPLGREGDAGDNPQREVLPDLNSLSDVANAVNALVTNLRTSPANSQTLSQLQVGLSAIQQSMWQNQQAIVSGFGKLEQAAQFIYEAVLQQLQNALDWAHEPQRQTDIKNLQQGALTVLGGLSALLLSALDPRNWWKFMAY